MIENQMYALPEDKLRRNLLLHCGAAVRHIEELEAEIVALHNPHTGNECDCDLCEKFGKKGSR